MTDNTNNDDTDSDNDTTSTALRWRFTNDVLAGVLIGTLCIAVLYDLHFGAALSDRIWTALAVDAGLASVWAFGTETVTAFKKIRQ